MTWRAFLEQPGAWRILIDLMGLAIAGGAYVVPLYTVLQDSAPEDKRSRMVGVNNVFNALFMVAGSVIAMAVLALTSSIILLFGLLAVLTLAAAVIICGLLPDALIKTLVKGALRLFYRVEVSGLQHYDNAPARAVVVVNHVSFLDGLLLAAFLPDRPSFAVNTFIAREWWVKPFLNLIQAFPVDPTNPMSMKSMVREVEKGRKLVIFPEGRITVTGALMKVFEGPGMVAMKADAQVIPIRLDGAQFTPFSRLRGKLRLRWFPKIKIHILPPTKLDVPPALKGRDEREAAGLALYDLMSDLIFQTCDTHISLFQALLDAKAAHGGGALVLEDAERQPMSYTKLVAASLALGRQLTQHTKRADKVGLLLPNVNGAVACFFALHLTGRTPAMLNYTAGAGALRAAAGAAKVETILTSKRFVAAGSLEPLIAALSQSCRILYVEDLRLRIAAWDQLYALLSVPLAGLIHRRYGVKSHDPAVILFTSGSEGAPKGVALTHSNLNANRHQLSARVDFSPSDIVFNALPLFHAFGLTGACLLPLLSGVKTVLYPSPLHYRIVPALAYDTNATILFGTDTFLAGYARSAHPYDFYSLRYVFAGAERVKPETRAAWAEKFGLRILEGYGATETAPVIAVNTPMHFKAGTVGRALPAIATKLEPVAGLEGGRLLVKGPNIMAGYYKADAPGQLQPPVHPQHGDGWYDTGDIVTIDPDGFITIAGRAKRFAKIAGEMVSLTVVEGLAEAAWPGSMNAAANVPDDRKGEAIILFTTNKEASRDALVAQAKIAGVTELAIPRDIRVVEEIPLLGTGKTDYAAVQRLAVEGTAHPA
jgi:acyl-[acyl-carrier-protein]-phospholipid O-acyltransferase / long-chain-fatty-acid--[acyl-carrier-protein] ligase